MSEEIVKCSSCGKTIESGKLFFIVFGKGRMLCEDCEEVSKYKSS
jgi:hypothetical protein